jgi:hypothetical protein
VATALPIIMVGACTLGVSVGIPIAVFSVVGIPWMEGDDFIGGAALTQSGSIESTDALRHRRRRTTLVGVLDDGQRRRRWMKGGRPCDISVAG